MFDWAEALGNSGAPPKNGHKSGNRYLGGGQTLGRTSLEVFESLYSSPEENAFPRSLPHPRAIEDGWKTKVEGAAVSLSQAC